MTGLLNSGRRYGRLIRPALSAMALLMVLLSFYLTSWLIGSGQSMAWLSPKVVLSALIAWIIAGMRLVRPTELRALKMEHTARSAIHACGCHLLSFIVLLYLTGAPHVEWSTLAIFYALLFLSLPVAYTMSLQLLKFMRRRGRNHSKVVIVGMNKTAARLYDMMRNDGYGYVVMGVFDDNPAETAPEGLQVMPLSALDAFIRENDAEEIFCTLAGDDETALLESMEVADNNAVTLHVVPQLSRFVNRGFAVNEIGRLPVMTPLSSPLASRFNVALKRSLDIVAALLGIALFPVFFIPIALCIKLTSPGPVFYRQKRTGLKGRTFDCLKFRTLLHDNSSGIQRAERRYVYCRPSTAYGVTYRYIPRSGGSLHAPSYSKTGDNRLGAGQRLQRRHRPALEDGKACGMRRVVYRTLVVAARPEDHCPDDNQHYQGR